PQEASCIATSPCMEETMSKNMRTQLRIMMVLSGVDGKWRHDTAAAIADLAPTSPMFAVSSIQASVAALAALSASLKAENETVATGRAKVASDVEKEANARRTFDAELLTLKAAVENRATQASDLTSMGFEQRGERRTRGQLTAPEA